MLSIILTIVVFILLLLNVDIEPLSRWYIYPLMFIFIMWGINMILFSLYPDKISNRKIVLHNKDISFRRDSIIVKIENTFTGILTYYKFPRYDCLLSKNTSGKLDEIYLIIPCHNKKIPDNTWLILFDPNLSERFNWIKRKNTFKYSENLGKIRIVVSNKNSYIISKFTLTDF